MTRPAPCSLAEKLLSRAAGRLVAEGEIAICRPDFAMGTDGSVPMALDYLRQMGADAPRDPSRLIFALDHYGATSGRGALALQVRARDFAQAHGIRIFDVGDGIGHQLLMEQGIAAPGRLVVGADSHATSYGALNCFGTGIGSSDLAGIMFCGQLWLEVPRTIRIVLEGRLRTHVSAKDLALMLARQLGADGASYHALEFTGDGVATLDMDDRTVLANMSVELGAKAGLFAFDDVLAAYMAGIGVADIVPTAGDPDHAAERTLHIDLTALRPQIALPHRVDNVEDLDAQAFTPVDVVYLGTCTGGRMRDYREALDAIGEGGTIAPGVSVVITPASHQIFQELKSSGMMARFAALGARIELPGCGACCGTCGTIPSDRQKIISSANRNFRGRMGNASAEIFLASPYSCARAAVRGGFGGGQESVP